MSKHVFTIEDAADDTIERRLTIEVDPHGATVALEGTEQTIVLDFCNGKLRVFIADEGGDVRNDPVGAIPQE